MVLRCRIIKISARLLMPVILLSAIAIAGCKVSFSLSGASISPQVKTISIQYFQNRASIVQPGLSQYITDKLIDKCKAQTRLSFINGIGDVGFEGEITDYNTRPLTVAADQLAAMNRFTITVKVKFTNLVQPELNYEKTFSRYEDYDSSLDLSQVEATLVEKIVALLVEDMFNDAFVNW
jgi:hypothetical protein